MAHQAAESWVFVVHEAPKTHRAAESWVFSVAEAPETHRLKESWLFSVAEAVPATHRGREAWVFSVWEDQAPIGGGGGSGEQRIGSPDRALCGEFSKLDITRYE